MEIYYEIVNDEGTHYIVQLENGRAGTNVVPHYVWNNATLPDPKLNFQQMTQNGWERVVGNSLMPIEYDESQFNSTSKRYVFEGDDGIIRISPPGFDVNTLRYNDAPRKRIIGGVYRSKRYRKNIRRHISKSKKNKKKKSNRRR